MIHTKITNKKIKKHKQLLKLKHKNRKYKNKSQKSPAVLISKFSIWFSYEFL